MKPKCPQAADSGVQPHTPEAATGSRARLDLAFNALFGKCHVVEGDGQKLSKPTVPHDLGRTRERCELPHREPIFGPLPKMARRGRTKVQLLASLLVF